jgi:hypothetical protein
MNHTKSAGASSTEMLALGLRSVWTPVAGERKSAHRDGPDQP